MEDAISINSFHAPSANKRSQITMPRQQSAIQLHAESKFILL